jgi:predicted nucleic acid-binding protein
VNFLLDTNVISEARKLAGNPNVRAWLSSVNDADLFISVLALGEIRQGIDRLRRRDSAQAAVLERWLGGLIRDYTDRIVPITAQIADEWGRLNSNRSLPVIDGLMAASANVLGFTLVTRNVADVAGTGVVTFNPFDPER